MSVQSRLLLTMTVLVGLLVSIAGVCWFGLWQMAQRLQAVSEEFAESRLLQPMDADISVAVFALRQQGEPFNSIAKKSLERARESIFDYLARQIQPAVAEEHQAIENSHANALLRRLDSMLLEFHGASGRPRIEDAEFLQNELSQLYLDDQRAAQEAHDSAKVTQRTTLSIVLTASLASAALCIGLSIWSTRSVIHRLRELHRTISVRSEGVLPQSTHDVRGVATQIEEINERMMRKLEDNSRELLRRERMAGIGLLAADVAHELNNPMNAVLGLSEVALRTLERGAVEEHGRSDMIESLRVIRREAIRCKGIVERLMAMVRAKRTAQWFDANRLLQETVEVAAAARPDRASCFHLAGAPVAIPVLAPQEDVRQILLTLLINAADAIETRGRIEVDATRTEDEVWIRVRDDGRGFTPEQQADFFTPFRTSRAATGGTGLGLSIAYTLAEEIGAEIRPASDGPGQGGMFILAIPINAEAAQ